MLAGQAWAGAFRGPACLPACLALATNACNAMLVVVMHHSCCICGAQLPVPWLPGRPAAGTALGMAPLPPTYPAAHKPALLSPPSCSQAWRQAL
jgi:hypothetical protein